MYSRHYFLLLLVSVLLHAMHTKRRVQRLMDLFKILALNISTKTLLTDSPSNLIQLKHVKSFRVNDPASDRRAGSLNFVVVVRTWRTLLSGWRAGSIYLGYKAWRTLLTSRVWPHSLLLFISIISGVLLITTASLTCLCRAVGCFPIIVILYLGSLLQLLWASTVCRCSTESIFFFLHAAKCSIPLQ